MASSSASPLAPNGGNTHLNHSALQRTKDQNPVEIFENGVDETKALTGKIAMVWKDKDQVEALVSIPPLLHETARGSHVFSVLIKLEPVFMAALDLKPDDEFRLSLQGGIRKNKANSRKKSTLSMCLFFTKGIHLEWGRAVGDWKTLNTWILNHDMKVEDGDSWYMSPKKSGVPNSLVPAKRRHDEKEDAIEVNNAMLVDEPAEGKKLSKSEKKRRRMEEKSRKAQKEPAQTSEPIAKPSVIDAPVYPVTDSTLAEPKINTHESAEGAPIQQWQSRSTKALIQVEALPAQTIVNLIGIVTSCSTPKPTATGDWSVSFDIIDPSSYHQNLKINCFTPRHVGWLPCPQFGDIIILRKVKKQLYKGAFNCVGYGNKTQWAIRTPQGDFHHGPNHAPENESVGRDGEGYTFSPFYKPTAEDEMCCIGLSAWWRRHEQANMPRRPANTTSTNTQTGRQVARVHRLIKDANPDQPPDGYFDCTVEVVKGFTSNQVYSLYVTDYTKNEFTPSVQTHWCPSTLSDQVLLVEMWDSAAAKGPTMKPGQIYSIKNMRMKSSQHGHLESKVCQSGGITLLSRDEIAFNENVKALLERKEAWEIKQSSKESQIEQKVIESVEEDKFFHCTVEVLQPVRRPLGELPHIYVTDYTPHQLLKPLVIEEPWARGLRGYIVKINLDNEQQDMADALEAGSFYCIRKLRLKKSPLDDYMKGNLGGNEKKLVKLNPEKAGNEHLNALLRRKEFWGNHHQGQEPRSRVINQDEPVPSPLRDDSVDKPELSSTASRFDGMKIKDFLPAKEEPAQLAVHAKVASYYPMELKDAVVRACTKCRTKLPPIELACTACADMDHEYVRVSLVVRVILEDEDGAQILVTVDNSCNLWRNLDLSSSPTDTILAKYWNQIRPCLGNLPEVHKAYNQKGSIPKECPFLTFNLESWAAPGGNRGYKLIDYSL